MAAKKLSNDRLLELYRAIVLPRLIEEKMLVLLRQGRISKWFSGIGQEAIAVGATSAIENDDFIFPLHRNLGVFTTRGMKLEQLFLQFQGRAGGFTKGRDRSFHFGSLEHHIVGMISHLGPQLALADGVALASNLRKSRGVALAFTGEGGTSEGDFHEAVNVAAVWDLPVIFIIENNGYGLSTPTTEQFRCKKLSDRAKGYGIEGVTIDGNDLVEVYQTVKTHADRMRKSPAPVIIECMTFRMRGHEEASGVKYVPPKLIADWAKKDPVARFEKLLMKKKVLSESVRSKTKAQLSEEISAAVESALAAPPIIPELASEMRDVYAPFAFKASPAKSGSKKMRLVDAISDGLREAMRRMPELVLMGQDIAEYGGVFKVTEGFVEEFGRARVRNTPICESAIVGAALGLSIAGMKSVVEMQFADFVSCAHTQVVNNLAKLNYRWGANADVVVRLPTGAGVRAGPFHSQSDEAWFFHVPGLKIVYPAFADDAKKLLIASIEDPNPVLFFEHKALYRRIEGEVSLGYVSDEIGKARLLRSGEHCSIVTYGAGVHWALEALDASPDVSADLIDLRTLAPLDWETIYSSVKKTGRVIVLHEDTLTGGIGAEIAARISTELFQYLDAPVLRSASLDTPVPFAAELEDQFLPKSRFETDLRKLIEY